MRISSGLIILSLSLMLAANAKANQNPIPMPSPQPPATASMTPTKTATPNPIRKICKKIRTLGDGGERVLYKYQASGHLRGSDRANSCSLIYGKGQNTFPRRIFLPIYDSKGKRIGTFKNYTMYGSSYAARWYTLGSGPSCYEIAKKAFRGTRKYRAYIGIGKGRCYKLGDLRRRQGRVR